MATKLEIHEAKEDEKWTRQNEINDRLEELVEKNTEAINSLNMTIANTVLGMISPIGSAIRNVDQGRKAQEEFQNSTEVSSHQQDQSEDSIEIDMTLLIIILIIVIVVLIVMCVCWYNILPDNFYKPFHILLLLFVTGFYVIGFLIYVGLINKHTLVRDQKRKKVSI